MNVTIKPKRNIKKTLSVPGDKSISHRAVMFGAIAEGTTEIEGFLMGDDCLSTIKCFRQLGIDIEVNENKVIVHGKGLYGLSKPDTILDVGNSGTTLRLITGLLAAQSFSCEITGDKSIQKRPMDRVITPLSQMGANIEGKFCPIKINGSKLKAIEYTLPVASAQVKSAILLASLYVDSQTCIIEPAPTRDHTEIMLNYLGANIKKDGNKIISNKVNQLYAKNIVVPADISSAAYFIVMGLIVPDSEILITDVGCNFTRTGIIDVLKDMKADISVLNERNVCGEVVADILVRTSELKSTTIGGSIIPRLIDEIPIIAVAACFAQGKTVIKDASELKVKESNRIKTIATELNKMGANIVETDDGMIIEGGRNLKGTTVESYNDHRVAMSLAVAALVADGNTTINNADCTDISFPDFFKYIDSLIV